MRRYLVGALLAGGLTAAMLASAALAAAPPRNHSFSGSGKDYWNQGSSWVRHGSGSFSFKTSGPGFYEYVTHFVGTYRNRCNGGTLHVKATNMVIHHNGSFGFHFKRKFSGSTAYVKIWGAFKGNGRSASVDYLVDFVKNGQHVNNPYDTAHPGRLGCASWVRGTAKG